MGVIQKWSKIALRHLWTTPYSLYERIKLTKTDNMASDQIQILTIRRTLMVQTKIAGLSVHERWQQKICRSSGKMKSELMATGLPTTRTTFAVEKAAETEGFDRRFVCSTFVSASRLRRSVAVGLLRRPVAESLLGLTE